MKKLLLTAVSCLAMSAAVIAADTQSTTANQTLTVDGVTAATYPAQPTILDQLTPSNACEARCQSHYEACVKWAPPWTNCNDFIRRCMNNCSR
ncbi:hypothetical protein [Pseudoalteromonas luteoviolacea]|uniref:ShKT domain-containing protein n=1 Tax=Pseudoalteromonas luteoviolacea H33 TaxID=1365251 RepID=A0A167A5K5_9GAMM|nr:hypothetical protein [Pseudoalteromonas luteoviolacea]KZN45006.1 hypothetical protein N476_25480 [Pseudoalteromonas luteoviolacea H33]KZN79320.1 hypothetical protein N477_00535 [Pseudoalteromonas luteoviolacea H33-S]